MANEESQPGAPKLNIELDSLFGGKTVEQVTVDSNNLDPIDEASAQWLEALAIPPRFCDQLLQVATWLSASTFITSLLTTVPISTDWVIPILLVLLVPSGATLYSYVQFPQLRWFIAYRTLLIAAGAALGVNL